MRGTPGEASLHRHGLRCGPRDHVSTQAVPGVQSAEKTGTRRADLAGAWDTVEDVLGASAAQQHSSINGRVHVLVKLFRHSCDSVLALARAKHCSFSGDVNGGRN